MKRYRLISLLILLSGLTSTAFAGESWRFVKEQDSIRIFTRNDKGKSLKTFKAVARIKAPADKIFSLLEDVNNTEWWDKSLSQIKVLSYVKNKSAQYYLVYDLPWPVTDRDVCVNVVDSVDHNGGYYQLIATPLTGVIAEKKDKIRIKDYYQTWTVKSINKNLSIVELEGFVDPAGNIPNWVFNLVMVNIPINSIKGVRKQMEKK